MKLWCSQCHTLWTEQCFAEWQKCPYVDCDGRLRDIQPEGPPPAPRVKTKPTYPLLDVAGLMPKKGDASV